MNKRNIVFIFSISLLALSFSVFQYFKSFQAELASATGTKPSNGHLWSEMECDSSGLCVSGTNVGIGTSDTAANKLRVVGNIGVDGNIGVNGVINATSNVCISGGSCLSDIAGFINSQPIAGGTTHNRANCTSTNSIDGSTKGALVTEVGIANPICRFAGNDCPTGWNKYENWKTTIPTYYAGGYNPPSQGYIYNSYCIINCTTGSHAWANIATETCSYRDGISAAVDPDHCASGFVYNGYATITQTGCF